MDGTYITYGDFTRKAIGRRNFFPTLADGRTRAGHCVGPFTDPVEPLRLRRALLPWRPGTQEPGRDRETVNAARRRPGCGSSRARGEAPSRCRLRSGPRY